MAERTHPGIVDLFSGVGGLSLGARQAGFDIAAAFDNDPVLTSSFSRNFPSTRVINRDLSVVSGCEVVTAAGGRPVGIVGGPPCQGFSTIGKRISSDPRRDLLEDFFRIVGAVGPAFFVMENVRGLGYGDARRVLEDGIRLVEDEYWLFGPTSLDAAEFGAATRRSRLFVIGIHQESGDPVSREDIDVFREPAATVGQAIADMEGAVRCADRDGFDWWRISRRGRFNEYAGRMRSPDRLFSGHRCTAHSKGVVDRFQAVSQGELDTVGRHPRLSWSGQCPTLRAGTGPDRGSYQSVRPIHPLLPRVITVREGARLQGFPDEFRFHPTIWHSFRMIGNSVCPIIAKAIFRAVRMRLANSLGEAVQDEA